MCEKQLHAHASAREAHCYPVLYIFATKWNSSLFATGSMIQEDQNTCINTVLYDIYFE